MRKIIFCLIVLCFIFISSCNKKTTVINNVITQTVDVNDLAQITSLEDALCNSIDNVKSSVVGVKATSNGLLNNESYGSGVVLKKDNGTYYIVTSRHVIMYQGKVYDNILIYLGNIEIYLPATVVSYDEKVDLALLNIETDVLLSCAIVANSIRCGQFCFSVGSPYDLETYYNSVSVGNISSIKRIVEESNYFYKSIENEYIQTTALLNEGCSGGGLFNINGELLGINTWKISSNKIDGMNFVISIEIVKEVFKNYL